MEALYFGEGYCNHCQHGPWVGVDMEVGVYGNTSAGQQPVDQDFVLAMVKGDSNNRFAVKVGDPQKGNSLKTVYDGPRPKGPKGNERAYEVMQKQGGIILGIGGGCPLPAVGSPPQVSGLSDASVATAAAGDNSPWGSGIFYEGAMTRGVAPPGVDRAVMQNVVDAQYK